MLNKLTILIASKAAQKELFDTLRMIREIDYKMDINILIAIAQIDGNKIDNSELLKPHKASIISRQDSGIYDAWNKLLRKAKTPYCMFLGIGDTIANLELIKEAITSLENSQAPCAYGQVAMTAIGGEIIRKVKRKYRNPDLFINKYLSTAIPMPTQGIIFRSEVLKRIHFDETYRIAGDYEAQIRYMRLATEPPIYLREIISYQAVGGVSTSPKTLLKTFQEWRHARRSLKLPQNTPAAFLRFLKIKALKYFNS